MAQQIQGKDETLKVKVGGRIVSPCFDVANGKPSTSLEQSFDTTLHKYAKDNIPLESNEALKRRERVLSRMEKLCQAWVKTVCRKEGLPPRVAEAAGGMLKTSGSYRLGVHEPGADIDCILVVPSMCLKEYFFGTTAASTSTADDGNQIKERDPDSLAERIRRHPDVTNFVPVEGAKVPILTFDWEGVNIDLLFARLTQSSVPPNFDIDQDSVLDGATFATEKSLNGPRVTNMIAAFMSGTPQRYQTFLIVVRCVRKWAKARGLYANKFGYWGGVNINLSVALCIQLYPNKSAASILRLFFKMMSNWRWPQPMMLTKNHDAGYGLQIWTPQNPRNQVAPILTPAYPGMNSTLSMSRSTLQIMQLEFARGAEITSRLWDEHKANPNAELNWKELFRPSDFFIQYPLYLSLCVVGPSQSEAQAWAGFVESRLRILAADVLGRSLPLSKIQLWPKKIEACIADRSSLLSHAQRANSVTYMIGFQVDKLRMRGNELNVELQMKRFRDKDLSRFSDFVDGMDILTKSFKCKNLPSICFEMYDGGKPGAMKRRRELRNADPVRQERRNKRKLAEMNKAKLELQARVEKMKKRKTGTGAADVVTVPADEPGTTSDEATLVKDDTDPETQNDSSAGPNDDQGEEQEEEDAQLETALNVAVDGADGEVKTQEEADEERKKLLSGELLAEGAEEIDDDELGYYTVDDARQSILLRGTDAANAAFQDIRSLPMREEESELLRKAGYTLYSDTEEEAIVIGGNQPTPFRSTTADVSEEEAEEQQGGKYEIKFRTKWDGLVELDAAGHVIDKGDEDFKPSKGWTGRMAGFEFKLGARGLGYYRTGKPVVVPSNMAY